MICSKYVFFFLFFFNLVLITLHFSRLIGNLSLIFVGNAKVQCSVQASYGTGQDKDFTGDEDPRSE